MAINCPHDVTEVMVIIRDFLRPISVTIECCRENSRFAQSTVCGILLILNRVRTGILEIWRIVNGGYGKRREDEVAKSREAREMQAVNK